MRRAVGIILGILVFFHYGLFTLLSDSHSLMVSWPWVLMVQAGLIYGVLWTIAQLWQSSTKIGHQFSGFSWLGAGLDWTTGLGILTLSLSVAFAEFPQTALWYCLITLGYLAILYGLATYLKQGGNKRIQLLYWQSGLSVAFIISSLSLWVFKTVLPELRRLQQLQSHGINASYDFSNLYLRNWAPFGHPNYVAGYLVLALPLLVTCVVLTKGWQRWLWTIGLGLGCIDLYSTNSRGGWLGLLVSVLVAAALLVTRSSGNQRRWISLTSLAALTMLVLTAGLNQRLRTTFTGLFNGGGEFTYRWITAYTGWQMGWSHPLTGLGLGSVPTLYQQYRPGWAGQEAEALFQLHSTPVQLWAELGLPGILVLLLLGVTIVRVVRQLLQIQWQQLSVSDRTLTIAIAAALAGYAACALTDYQVDNPAIAGLLIVELATLAALYDNYVQPAPKLESKFQPLTVGFVNLTLLGAVLWLVPVNQAWAASHEGFDALQQQPPNLNRFVEQLERAYQFTPWESYYAYQMGWTLGNLVITNPNPQIAKDLTPEAIKWFERAILVSPASEFGRSSLGWLLLDSNPEAATKQFSEAAKLMPSRRTVFWGLGQGWLGQKQAEKGIEAIALEFVRHPLLITSPLWQNPAWQALYAKILDRTETIQTELLAQLSSDPELQRWLYQTRGALRWWRGNTQGAAADFNAGSSQLGKFLLSVGAATSNHLDSQLNPAQKADLDQAIQANAPWALAIAAWRQPQRRTELLQQGWLAAGENLSDQSVISALVKSMSNSTMLNQWLQQKAPSRPFRIQRTGFGVLARHIDGHSPQDFAVLLENLPMTYYFADLFPSLRYAPALDTALVPYQRSVFFIK